jgi:hypothetical protein
MSTPVRWIVAGVVLLLVLGLVVLYLFNMNLPMSSTEQQGGPLWVVLPGDSITLAPVEVGPDDKYLCERKGSINGTPRRGTGVSNSEGLSVETAENGTVTVSCEPGPPGSV